MKNKMLYLVLITGIIVMALMIGCLELKLLDLTDLGDSDPTTQPLEGDKPSGPRNPSYTAAYVLHMGASFHISVELNVISMPSYGDYSNKFASRVKLCFESPITPPDTRVLLSWDKYNSNIASPSFKLTYSFDIGSEEGSVGTGSNAEFCTKDTKMFFQIFRPTGDSHETSRHLAEEATPYGDFPTVTDEPKTETASKPWEWSAPSGITPFLELDALIVVVMLTGVWRLIVRRRKRRE